MAFDEQMRAKFIALFNDRGIKLRCPVCGGNDWAMGEKLAVVMAADIESNVAEMKLGNNPAFAMVYVSCKRCYAVQLFDVAAAGLLD